MTERTGPLQDVRILDLTQALAGPFCTMLLADLGADVIKMEGPAGDTTRGLPPVITEGRGGMFLNINRGKRSLALDLKLPAARDVVLRLSRDADIFIHSMRAAAIGRLGLGYQALRAEKDNIIYANMYGFGAADAIRIIQPMMISFKQPLASHRCRVGSPAEIRAMLPVQSQTKSPV